eukprot:8206645-Alexandrium_andersonii.AAC.1
MPRRIAARSAGGRPRPSPRGSPRKRPRLAAPRARPPWATGRQTLVAAPEAHALQDLGRGAHPA